MFVITALTNKQVVDRDVCWNALAQEKLAAFVSEVVAVVSQEIVSTQAKGICEKDAMWIHSILII